MFSLYHNLFVALVISHLGLESMSLVLIESFSCHFLFLAHLSRRLIGELIVYPWYGVRRPSVVRLNLNLNLNSLLVKRQIDNPSPGAVTGGN